MHKNVCYAISSASNYPLGWEIAVNLKALFSNSPVSGYATASQTVFKIVLFKNKVKCNVNSVSGSNGNS